MKKESLILALDQGTTSSRAILFDHEGQPVQQAQQEFSQNFPRPGWVEHDPEEIWNSQLEVMREVLGTRNEAAVEAIGITNQRETTLVWERESGQPLGPAIVWQDRRTAAHCRKMKEDGLADLFRERTGLILDPYFSGTKLAWILDHHEGARDRARRGELLFGTVDTWLLWKLPGGRVHATDASNASRTLMMNIGSGVWDDELLEILDIPKAMLPEIRNSSEVLGKTQAEGIPAGIPVSGMAGDQQAALFGQACFTPGMVKNTYGTGCFTLVQTGAKRIESRSRLLTTVAWKINDQTEYALEGSVFVAGAVIQWLRDELKLIETASECDELAATVKDSNGAYLVPAFTGLGAPHWDPQARGIVAGLSRGVNRAHLCRAALESIAFQSADLITAMGNDMDQPLRELRVDGGASRSGILLQFQADLLQLPVIRPECVETTALGAAYLAGLAVGYWDSREEIARNWREDRRFDPEKSPDETENNRKGWAKALKRCRNWEDA